MIAKEGKVKEPKALSEVRRDVSLMAGGLRGWSEEIKREEGFWPSRVIAMTASDLVSHLETAAAGAEILADLLGHLEVAKAEVIEAILEEEGG